MNDDEKHDWPTMDWTIRDTLPWIEDVFDRSLTGVGTAMRKIREAAETGDVDAVKDTTRWARVDLAVTLPVDLAVPAFNLLTRYADLMARWQCGASADETAAWFGPGDLPATDITQADVDAELEMWDDPTEDTLDWLDQCGAEWEDA